MDVWPQLMEAAFMQPWLGWGIKQTAEAHNAVAHSYIVSLPFSYSHNLIIDLILWVGMPVTGCLILMATVWLWRRVWAIKTIAAWYGLAIALPLAVHSLLEFPFAYAYFLVPAMVGVGALEGELRKPPAASVRVSLAGAGMMLVTILSTWIVIEYMQVEEDFRIARFEQLKIGEASSYGRSQVVLLTQLRALTEATRMEPKSSMTAEQIELLKKVALHYPWSGTQYRYAMALALNGYSIEAARQLQVIRAFHGQKIYLKFQIQIEDELKAQNQSINQSINQ